MGNIPLIAIVDDDAGLRQSLDGLIRSLGYHVALFSSAEAFLDSAESLLAQCVISDLQMPGGMDGVELAKNVGPQLRGRVILLSAYASEKMRALAAEADVHCFLNKPFDGQTLVDCIESALKD